MAIDPFAGVDGGDVRGRQMVLGRAEIRLLPGAAIADCLSLRYIRYHSAKKLQVPLRILGGGKMGVERITQWKFSSTFRKRIIVGDRSIFLNKYRLMRISGSLGGSF